MKKHPHQTCLRLPDVLKEEMTTICDRYQIHHSDLMRRAISEFVQTINANPQDHGKLMFV
jgi:predicted transcriptional regulator